MATPLPPTPPQLERPTALPRVFRTLAALLVLDLFVGVWLALHTDKAVEIFLSQVPVLGAAGVAWGFLPKEPKEEFGNWLNVELARPRVFRAVIVTGLLFLAVTLATSTVGINAIDSNISEHLYLNTGEEYRADPASRSDSGYRRLNRLTNPVHFSVWLPWGRKVWLNTGSMVTKQPVRVWPLLPTTLQYPEDFEPMMTVAILPGSPYFESLFDDIDSTRAVIIRAREGGDTLAVVRMDSAVAHIVRFSSQHVDMSVLERNWDSLLSTDTDTSSARQFLLSQWMRSATVPTRRPLRPGEWIIVELLPGKSSASDTVTITCEVRLNEILTDVYLRTPRRPHSGDCGRDSL